MKKWIIPTICLAFAAFSLITLKSIADYLVWRQLMFFALGFMVFFIVSRQKFSLLAKYSDLAYFILNFILLALLIFGRATKGTTGWITLFFGFKFQPSQLAIPIVSVFLISQLPRLKLDRIKDFLILLAAICLPALLIFVEPDFGSAIIYLLSVGGIILFIKVPHKYILGLMGVALLLAFFAWNFLLKDYQKERFYSFGGASEDNYHARQSLIAVGSGRLMGRGIGFGLQSHLKFLPERQTDFIFASLAEEWGFFGSAIIIVLYFVLIIFFIYVTSKFYDSYLGLLALINALMIFIQVTINIGMNMGLLPITGITLPFISYGGSSIISLFISFALVQQLLEQQQKGLKLDIK